MTAAASVGSPPKARQTHQHTVAAMHQHGATGQLALDMQQHNMQCCIKILLVLHLDHLQPICRPVLKVQEEDNNMVSMLSSWLQPLSYVDMLQHDALVTGTQLCFAFQHHNDMHELCNHKQPVTSCIHSVYACLLAPSLSSVRDAAVQDKYVSSSPFPASTWACRKPGFDCKRASRHLVQ